MVSFTMARPADHLAWPINPTVQPLATGTSIMEFTTTHAHLPSRWPLLWLLVVTWLSAPNDYILLQSWLIPFQPTWLHGSHGHLYTPHTKRIPEKQKKNYEKFCPFSFTWHWGTAVSHTSQQGSLQCCTPIHQHVGKPLIQPPPINYFTFIQVEPNLHCQPSSYDSNFALYLHHSWPVRQGGVDWTSRASRQPSCSEFERTSLRSAAKNTNLGQDHWNIATLHFFVRNKLPGAENDLHLVFFRRTSEFFKPPLDLVETQ